jgi:dephospho-CoA kinase/ASC-1-like (ASCH) protein
MLTSLKRILFQDRGMIKNGLHLAIIDQPFLDLILSGNKKIETRFSVKKHAPYQKVAKGDIVFFKEPSKPIIGYFTVKNTEYYNSNLNEIKIKYSNDICSFADPEFWEKRKEKKYVSLIWIDEIKKINPFDIKKKDRRGWVSFEEKKYKYVLLISGKICSGKSYWVKRISEHFNCDHVSFSSYIKYLCQKNNKEINRKNLQEMGTYAVASDIEKFIYYLFNCCIEIKSDTLIIDGLRHKKVFEEIKKKYYNTKIIYINCPENIRKERIIKRDGVYISINDTHSTENEYDELLRLSSYIINNNQQVCSEKILADLQDIVTFFME